eukprot:6193074-Pleurochrysis_carterae.AAC.3
MYPPDTSSPKYRYSAGIGASCVIRLQKPRESRSTVQLLSSDVVQNSPLAASCGAERETQSLSTKSQPRAWPHTSICA